VVMSKRAARRRRKPKDKRSAVSWPPAAANIPPLPVLIDLSEGNEESYRAWRANLQPARQRWLLPDSDAWQFKRQASRRNPFDSKSLGSFEKQTY
jgi:hypothetical protein